MILSKLLPDQASKAFEKECGFPIEEALLLYNFKTKKAEWREGLQCWLKNLENKPFELKLSFDHLESLKEGQDAFIEEVKEGIKTLADSPLFSSHDIPTA